MHLVELDAVSIAKAALALLSARESAADTEQNPTTQDNEARIKKAGRRVAAVKLAEQEEAARIEEAGRRIAAVKLAEQEAEVREAEKRKRQAESKLNVYVPRQLFPFCL